MFSRCLSLLIAMLVQQQTGSGPFKQIPSLSPPLIQPGAAVAHRGAVSTDYRLGLRSFKAAKPVDRKTVRESLQIGLLFNCSVVPHSL